jgi:hypothetical protein
MDDNHHHHPKSRNRWRRFMSRSVNYNRFSDNFTVVEANRFFSRIGLWTESISHPGARSIQVAISQDRHQFLKKTDEFAASLCPEGLATSGPDFIDRILEYLRHAAPTSITAFRDEVVIAFSPIAIIWLLDYIVLNVEHIKNSQQWCGMFRRYTLRKKLSELMLKCDALTEHVPRYLDTLCGDLCSHGHSYIDAEGELHWDLCGSPTSVVDKKDKTHKQQLCSYHRHSMHRLIPFLEYLVGRDVTTIVQAYC